MSSSSQLKGTKRLDRRISLMSATAAADAYGGLTETWAAYSAVSAAVEYPMAGTNEQINNGIQTATTSVSFTIRHNSTVTPIHRVEFDGAQYDIVEIRQIGRKIYTQIIAKRRQ